MPNDGVEEGGGVGGHGDGGNLPGEGAARGAQSKCRVDVRMMSTYVSYPSTHPSIHPPIYPQMRAREREKRLSEGQWAACGSGSTV